MTGKSRKSKPYKTDLMFARMGARERRAPGGTLVEVMNPGNKAIMHLGVPVAVRVGGKGEFAWRACTFDLPADWRPEPAATPGPHGGRVLARQDGTPRVLVVYNEAGPCPISEVLF